MNTDEAMRSLAAWPRTSLGDFPTPLLRMDTISAALGVGSGAVWLKADDYTGFALGGNKVRKLETELTPARLQGIDTLISCGGAQSNHARVTAAAAAHLGLRCVLVINGEPPQPPTGNARLHRLLTPDIIEVATRADRDSAMERERQRLESLGRHALVVPIGASTGRGALGYAAAMLELANQWRTVPGWRPETTWIFVATSSGGTLAGLLLGRALLGWDQLRIVAVSADDPPQGILPRVEAQAAEAAGLIGFADAVRTDHLTVTDRFVGAGYGIPTPESTTATTLWAQKAGVLLDPVYTAKAAAGLSAWIGEGRIETGDRVLFWHTGGQAALLA